LQTDREPATGPRLDLKTSADSAALHGASELERLAYLDGWRGIAILLVLEAHFLGWLPVDSGRLGVNVFFCLSGILMGRILFIRRVPLGTFYKRRFSRIYPAFAAYVLTIFLAAFFLGISFTALYLWQQPFYFMKSHLWGGSATAFAVAVTIGVCSFYFLENPARTWLNENW
jgi:peptidoglycan/LPS O-acetylase OafA/YrhL